ncbi:hypothetical protein JXM67_03050 [candidate division WOR-3 bacterium]|nr:hypothetical protein [candidate division WOR-3 bacterium]
MDVSNKGTVAVKEASLKDIFKPGLGFSIVDGIIDLLPAGSDPISQSYDKASDFYDSYMTSANFISALYNRIVWGIRDDIYAGKVCSFISGDLKGVILDVPVGTGELTLDRYAQLKKSTIIACDYTPGMLYKALKLRKPRS